MKQPLSLSHVCCCRLRPALHRCPHKAHAGLLKRCVYFRFPPRPLPGAPPGNAPAPAPAPPPPATAEASGDAGDPARSGAAASSPGGAPLVVAAAGPNGQLGFLSALRVTARLHALCPQTFPLPHGAGGACGGSGGAAGDGGEVPGRLLTRVRLHPGELSADTSGCPPREKHDVEALQREAAELVGSLGRAAAGAPARADGAAESGDGGGTAAATAAASVRAAPAGAPGAVDALGAADHGAPDAPARGGTRNGAAAAALRQSLLKGGTAASAAPPAPPRPPQQQPPPPAPPPAASANAAAPRLLFLGTGCAEPSKFRGGSAILLSVPAPGDRKSVV